MYASVTRVPRLTFAHVQQHRRLQPGGIGQPFVSNTRGVGASLPLSLPLSVARTPPSPNSPLSSMRSLRPVWPAHGHAKAVFTLALPRSESPWE